MENTSENGASITKGRKIFTTIRRNLDYLMPPNTYSEKELSFSHGVYTFPFLKDPYLHHSPYREAIEAIDIEQLTIQACEAAAEELDVTQRIEVVTSVPRNRSDKTQVLLQTGIGAESPTPTRINSHIDPTNPRVAVSLQERKPRQLAHEVNHIARMQEGLVGNTLLDGLIAEGLATQYEENFGGSIPPALWNDALTPEQIITEWRKAQAVLDQPRDHAAWFLDEGSDHPLWTGYALGNAIVKSYIANHPDQPMRQLVRLPSHIILQKSNFNP